VGIKRIAIVVGTRPEAIKMSPVYLAMKTDPGIDVKFVVTAQHRELLDQVLSVFKIRPDADLDLMSFDQSLAEISAKVIIGVRRILAEIKPDAVLVQGDTTTCLFSALAAFYENISVGHVEAGLRTYNFQAPWPEEMNRRLTDPISRWCFAPTTRAAENLRAEGIPGKNIFVTGNTAVDALLLAREMIYSHKPVIPGLPDNLFDGRRLILVTGHRRESFGRQIEEICMALSEIVRLHPDTVLVYPVHLNPNVQEPVRRILEREERIYLVEPVEYLQFVYLMDKSYMLITDSGGIQEEAPTLQKPTLVTRNTTERPEAVESGSAKLVGTLRKTIVREASVLLNDKQAYAKMSKVNNPFGDGHAARKIIEILSSTI
jgi:UDP-N-acetylglucosamine 2-epimerase